MIDSQVIKKSNSKSKRLLFAKVHNKFIFEPFLLLAQPGAWHGIMQIFYFNEDKVPHQDLKILVCVRVPKLEC